MLLEFIMLWLIFIVSDSRNLAPNVLFCFNKTLLCDKDMTLVMKQRNSPLPPKFPLCPPSTLEKSNVHFSTNTHFIIIILTQMSHQHLCQVQLMLLAVNLHKVFTQPHFVARVMLCGTFVSLNCALFSQSVPDLFIN